MNSSAARPSFPPVNDMEKSATLFSSDNEQVLDRRTRLTACPDVNTGCACSPSGILTTCYTLVCPCCPACIFTVASCTTNTRARGSILSSLVGLPTVCVVGVVGVVLLVGGIPSARICSSSNVITARSSSDRGDSKSTFDLYRQHTVAFGTERTTYPG